MKPQRICVIGAGFSGLVTARTLREYGYTVHVFEKADSIGGVWHPANCYPGLRTQSPRDCYAFSDFPMPQDYPEFPNAAQIHRYLLAYADLHGLFSHISMATSVIAVTRGKEDPWEVRLRRQGDASEWVQGFDFVISCNGVFSRPSMPELPNRAEFEARGGTIFHSSQLHDIEPLRDRDVVVVGFGKSALDIAEASLPVARSTTIACHRTLWKVPRYFLGFINAKHFILSRLAEFWLPHYRMKGVQRAVHERLPWLVDFYWRLSERGIGLFLGLSRRDLRPEFPLRRSVGTCFGLAPADTFRALRSGRLKLRKGRIAGLTATGLRLADGAEITAQTIVLATGFVQECEFLDATMRAALFDGDGVPQLYRFLVCPDIPAFAVNGYNGGGASQLSAEIGARWIAQLLAGKLKLPDKQAMKDQIARDLAHRRSVIDTPRGLGYYAAPFMFTYFDQLLEDMGQQPADSGKSFWRRYFTAVDPRDYAPSSPTMPGETS